ncbi:MAG TPA: VOC family protein [Xanthobacteraceae bacterium]|nr:VOC family protein [Xanthobacteraceae bacterium]
MSTPFDRRLPCGDEIFLDHVGHFVHDVEAACAALARAGFAPTPLSIQTQPGPAGGAPRLTGTGNVTAMLAHGYVEVLFKTADSPLGLELNAALARYAGVHLAAFAVADAEREQQRLARDGFRVRPVVHMQRPVETVGGLGTAAFTVTRLEPGEMPEGRIQLLTHHTEQLVWQPRWLLHPNGALRLDSVVIAVPDPEEAAARFARLAGRSAHKCLHGYIIELDRGRVELVRAEAFAEMLPDIPSLPFIGAYRLRVASLAIAKQCLEQAGLEPRPLGGDLVCRFPPELGCGIWLFSSADESRADPR